MWVKIREAVRHARNGGDTKLLEKGEKHDLPVTQATSLIEQGFAEETDEPKAAKAPSAKAAASKRKAPAKRQTKPAAEPAPAEPTAPEPHLETAPAEVAAED